MSDDQVESRLAALLGHTPRHWPPTLIAHNHWVNDFARAASSGGVDLSLDEAVAELNDWINEVN